MISKQFKKSLIKNLKNDYNIICHSIGMKDQTYKHYQDYFLSCKTNHKLFTLTLRVNICHVDAPSRLHSFNVFLESDCIDHIPHLKENINYDNVITAIQEVREVFSYLSPNYGFLFIHNTVTLISGIYFVGSSYFDVKSIKSSVDTTNFVNIYNCTNREHHCSKINIINNKIYVEPCGHYLGTAFKDSSNLLSSDLTLFKADFAKSFILFLNQKYRNEYNDEEPDYMPLDYENLKRYLLVHKMSTI